MGCGASPLTGQETASSAPNALGIPAALRMEEAEDEGGAPLISDTLTFPCSREQSSNQDKSRREDGSLPSFTHSMGR